MSEGFEVADGGISRTPHEDFGLEIEVRYEYAWSPTWDNGTRSGLLMCANDIKHTGTGNLSPT